MSDEYVAETWTFSGKRYGRAVRVSDGCPWSSVVSYFRFLEEDRKAKGLPPLTWTKNGLPFIPPAP